MAKIYGINGVITGKLGAAVYAVRNGEQISRQYQPIVGNPQTAGQIAARAKLKLMSQLSAVMAPVIAIPKVGNVSSRNMFVKTNYGTATYSDGQANIVLESVKLTRGITSLPPLSVNRTGASVTVGLDTGLTVNVSRVVYVGFFKEADNSLRYSGSAVAAAAGTDNHWQATLVMPASSEGVVYAYGIRDNTENARVAFGDLQVVTAETVAKILVTRVLLETDVTLTETKAALVTTAS